MRRKAERREDVSGLRANGRGIEALGERDDEIRIVLADLRAAGVDIVTLGQYLAPEKSAFYLPVDRFVHPDEFKRWARVGREMGFRHVEAGPLVRSSYHAEEQAAGRRPNG